MDLHHSFLLLPQRGGVEGQWGARKPHLSEKVQELCALLPKLFSEWGVLAPSFSAGTPESQVQNGRISTSPFLFALV